MLGVLTVTTIGPPCALRAPVRQDGLDRDRVAELIESLFNRPSTDGCWQFLSRSYSGAARPSRHNMLALS